MTKRILGSILLILVASITLYSATGTPSNLTVRTDANNALVVTAVTQVNPVTQGVFSSRTLRTDASGNLQVILGGTVTPTYPQSIPASDCSAPSLALSGDSNTGIAFTVAPVIADCINGVAITLTDAAGVVVAGNIQATNLTATSSLVGTGALGTGATGFMDWAGKSRIYSPLNGQFYFTTQNNSSGFLYEQFTDNPTCATNCGTSPTLTGVDSSFTLTMGASGVPASGFVVTFNGTWAAAPQCVASMAKAGMVVGKMILTIVTTTTNATFVTNGTAPATTDMYHVRCSSGL